MQALYSQRTPATIPIGILDHMALLYVDQQQNKEAIELSQLSVNEHPTSGRALRNLAHVYEKLDMSEQALSAYQQALATAIINKHKSSSIQSHRKTLANYKVKINLH